MSNEDKHAEAEQKPAKTESPKVDNENSPGKQLTKAREALGLTQKQIAVRLHLRLHSVQAVEQDELEEGVSVTFNKGYVRLYAKLVHLDEQAILEAYDKIHKQNTQPAKLQSFSRRVTREAHDYRWNLVTIVVVLLVLGSVVGWWVQQSDSFKDSQRFVADTFDSLFSETQNTQNADNINENPVINEADEAADEADVVRLNTGPEITDEAVAELDGSVNEIEQDTGEVEVQNQVRDTEENIEDSIEANIETNTDNIIENTNEIVDEASEQASEQINEIVDNTSSLIGADKEYLVNDDGTVDMAFTFNDDCWVSVKDVNGEVIAIGVKTKGRVMQVSGLPPIQVILGTAQVVELNFGGLDIDMSSYSGGRSANFTLPIEND
jgi:cytoskeleton protein RodZ